MNRYRSPIPSSWSADASLRSSFGRPGPGWVIHFPGSQHTDGVSRKMGRQFSLNLLARLRNITMQWSHFDAKQALSCHYAVHSPN